MANIRVTCPACKSELEVDAQFEGRDVECGNCLEVFKATKPGAGGSVMVFTFPLDPKPRRAGDRPRWRRRRRDDDDDYSPPRASGGENGLAVASLVLGVLSIMPGCCCDVFTLPISLSAIATGAVAMGQHNGKEMAVAGLACGAASVGFIVLRFFTGFGMLFFNAL